MPDIYFNGTKFSYTITHTKRKTIQLKILSADKLAVAAPIGCSHQYIEELLQEKAKWILKKSAHHRELEACPVNKSLADGGQILYMGTPRPIISQQTKAAPKVDLTAAGLCVSLKPNTPDEKRAQLIRCWYVEEAARYLTDMTEFWAKKIGCQPSNISLRDQKTRWGSCSSRGSISFNWRIIMAPPEVIDYLIVHELCHILVPNHSAAFWRKVAEFLPNYDQHRQWLKNNGGLLKQIL